MAAQAPQRPSGCTGRRRALTRAPADEVAAVDRVPMLPIVHRWSNGTAATCTSRTAGWVGKRAIGAATGQTQEYSAGLRRLRRTAMDNRRAGRRLLGMRQSVLSAREDGGDGGLSCSAPCIVGMGSIRTLEATIWTQISRTSYTSRTVPVAR